MNGLTFAEGASGSTVKALQIRKFTDNGILLNNSANNTIGGPAAADRNIITENDKAGVAISGENAFNNLLINNYIGTDGTNLKANKEDGVLLSNGPFLNRIGDGNTAHRNVISGNDRWGIGIMNNAVRNTVSGNYIGTDKDGMTGVPNQAGVFIGTDSSDNIIGGTRTLVKGSLEDPANIISGNKEDGVLLAGITGTVRNKILGNYIGVDKTGNAKLPNGHSGIFLLVAAVDQTFIGGSTLQGVNVISGNGNQAAAGFGIWISTATNTVIKFNNIGLGKDRAKKGLILGNKGQGIQVDPQAGPVTIKESMVAFNGGDGISAPPGKVKVADPNLIYNNGGLGIDIGDDGVTTDQMPVITSATVSGLTTQVQGSLSADPNSEYLLEFFGNVTADPSGYGEGESFLGDTTVFTDANGNATFSVTLDAVYGQYLSATATGTDPDGYTSEFSAVVAVSGGSSLAAVGNYVWEDLNLNGLQDPGETGLQGVEVQLYEDGVGFLQSTFTDQNGQYSFTDLTPADYYLQFIAPGGYFFTNAYQGDATLDSNADPSTGETEVFTLIAGEYNPTLDAGLRMNSSPVAEDDFYSTVHDQTLTTYPNQFEYGVLYNDWDADGDPLTVNAVEGSAANVATPVLLASGAVLTVQADGSFVYTPGTSYTGLDSFTYAISDGIATATATVYIDVTNSAPSAFDDYYSTLHDQTLTTYASQYEYGVLYNDSDDDGDPITVSAVEGSAANVGTQITLASGATLTVNADGSFTYTPAMGYTGPDGFTYEVSDGVDASTATVYIDVTNSAPSAFDDYYVTIEDQTLITYANQYEYGVLYNDWDADGDSLTVSAVEGSAANVGTQITLASGASLTVNSDGSFTYTPATSYTGMDSFSYQVTDGVDTSTATVYIDVTSPLQAASSPGNVSAAEVDLSQDALQPILAEAITRWAAIGLSSEQVDLLHNIEVTLTDLPQGYLGLGNSHGIWLDSDASGHGWFIDTTPGDDLEFSAEGSGLVEGMDLLTVVAHELGHSLGLDDLHAEAHPNNLMAHTLSVGVRRTPSAENLADLSVPEPPFMPSTTIEPPVEFGSESVHGSFPDAAPLLVEPSSPVAILPGQVEMSLFGGYLTSPSVLRTATLNGEGDLLLAGTGDDLQVGSQGRDLLIGGAGQVASGRVDAEVLLSSSPRLGLLEQADLELVSGWSREGPVDQEAWSEPSLGQASAGEGTEIGWRGFSGEGGSESTAERSSLDGYFALLGVELASELVGRPGDLSV